MNNTQKSQSTIKQQKSKWLTLAWWTSLSGVITAISLLVAVIGVVVAIVAIVISLSTSNKGNTPGPTSQPNIDLQRTPWLGLEFWQNDTQAYMTDHSAPQNGSQPAVVYVTLKSAPFEIHFPKLPDNVGVKICASTDSSVLSLQAGAKTGAAGMDYPCFRLGAGIADTKFNSATLYLADSDQFGLLGFNYLIGSRVEQISDTIDKVYFSRITRPGKETPLSEWKQDLYLVVWISKSSDYVVGIGTFERIVLHFAN